MTRAADIRAAGANDLADIQELVRQANLPHEDISAQRMPQFVVARGNDDELLAAGGIEIHGDDALLRSVVVSDRTRGSGLGRIVVSALESRARAAGINAIYLLTTTAGDYFPRLGYEPFPRGSVPSGIAESTQFMSLCPASAVCLQKILE